MFKEIQIEFIKFLQQFSNQFLDGLNSFISFFGESIFVIIVIGYIYWIKDKKYGHKLITTMVSSMVFNNALKGVVRAPRPYQDDNSIRIIKESTATGYSFPSGHSQTAATLYTSLMRYFKKNWLNILLPILIFLIMFSRMYLGAHYPVDVLVGCILGVLFALLMPLILDKLDDYKWFLAILCVVFLPFGVLYMIRKDVDTFDFFKMYGLLIGYLLAYMYERRYVNFSCDISNGKKAIRYIVGIVLVASIQGGLKYLFSVIFPDPSFYLKSCLYMIRYGLITFIGLGLYPHLFKKLNF